MLTDINKKMCLYDVPTFNYYAYSHDTAQVACGRNYEKIGKITVQRLAQGLSLTGQGLLRFIELKTFRSVTGYSISM